MHGAHRCGETLFPCLAGLQTSLAPIPFRLLLHTWKKNGNVLHWKSPLCMWVETVGGTSYLLSARLKQQLLHNLHPHGRLHVTFAFEFCVFHVVVVKH